MRQCFSIVTAAVLLTSPAWADTMPAKDSSSLYPTNYGLGYSDDVLYLHTGDSIYRVDATDPADPSFSQVIGGLQSAFPDYDQFGERWFEGGFATAPGGKAFVSFGASHGGALLVDLTHPTTTAVADFDTANLYSAAGQADGDFYTMFVDPDWTNPTQVYRVDGQTGNATYATDPSTDPASGGMAFDAEGNLYVGTLNYLTSPNTVHFFRIDAEDLAIYEAGGGAPGATALGGSEANGNGQMVVDHEGNIYFNTTTGIGRFDPLTGQTSTLYGDLLDPNLFTYGNTTPYSGLAYDAAGDRLVFGEYDADLGGYELRFVAVPEPAGAAVLLLGAAMLLRRRQEA